jgi:hypothetical protein
VYDNVDPNVDSDRTYEENFYLGSSQEFNLSRNTTATSCDACALFFTKVTNLMKFDEDNIANSIDTCDDALTFDCVNALLNKATKAVESFLSTSEPCQRLLSDFTDSLASQCPQFETGDKWQGLQVQGMLYLRL